LAAGDSFDHRVLHVRVRPGEEQDLVGLVVGVVGPLHQEGRAAPGTPGLHDAAPPLLQPDGVGPDDHLVTGTGRRAARPGTTRGGRPQGLHVLHQVAQQVERGHPPDDPGVVDHHQVVHTGGQHLPRRLGQRGRGPDGDHPVRHDRRDTLVRCPFLHQVRGGHDAGQGPVGLHHRHAVDLAGEHEVPERADHVGGGNGQDLPGHDIGNGAHGASLGSCG